MEQRLHAPRAATQVPVAQSPEADCAQPDVATQEPSGQALSRVNSPSAHAFWVVFEQTVEEGGAG
jgi:hypothetical protein